MEKKPTQSREGVKGQLPLAESRGSASGGVWGNAPTVPRQTYSKEEVNKVQAAKRPCPKLCASSDAPPSCSFDQLCCVAPNGRDRTACLSDVAGLFRKQGNSRLRARVGGNENRRSLRSPPTPLRSAHPCSLTVIAGWENRNCPPSAPQSFPHAAVPDSQTAPPAPGTAARRPSAPQTG